MAIRYDNSTKTSLWPPELIYYSPAFHRGQAVEGSEPARHYFCKICSCNLFIVGNIVEPKIGEFLSLNTVSLDLKSVGKDLKKLSNPKGLTYVNGLNDTFVSSAGEPHAHGSW